MGVALGATAEDIDAMFSDARIQQLAAVDGGKIDPTGLFQAKLARYVRAYFVATPANSRSNRRVDVRRFGAVEPVHFFQRADYDLRCRAAPSRMYGCHGAIPVVSQQYGVTIRSANRYRNPRVSGHKGIAFRYASDLLRN